MPISALRHFLPCVAALAALSSILLLPAAAQEQLTPPSQGASGPSQSAPVGHRQPRVADVTPSDKTAAELLEERQQAELNRKLRICRGC